MEDDMSLSIRSGPALFARAQGLGIAHNRKGLVPRVCGGEGPRGPGPEAPQARGAPPVLGSFSNQQERVEDDMSYSMGWGAEFSKGKMSSPRSGNPPQKIPTTPRGVATTSPLGGNRAQKCKTPRRLRGRVPRP